MTDTGVPEPQPQLQPEAQAGGFFSNLANLYFAPTEAFTSILCKPSIWLPLALIVVLSLAVVGVWTSHLDATEFAKIQLQESGQWDRMKPEEQEQMLGMQAMAMKPIIWAAGLIMPPLFIVIIAAVLLLMFRVATGAPLGFGQSMAITTWSSLAVGLVQTPLMILTLFLKGDWNLPPDQALQANLSLLLDKAEVGAVVWSLAGAIDLFSLWTIFLLAVGYGVATKRSWVSALWPIVVPWALFVLGRAGISAIFS